MEAEGDGSTMAMRVVWGFWRTAWAWRGPIAPRPMMAMVSLGEEGVVMMEVGGGGRDAMSKVWRLSETYVGDLQGVDKVLTGSLHHGNS